MRKVASFLVVCSFFWYIESVYAQVDVVEVQNIIKSARADMESELLGLQNPFAVKKEEKKVISDGNGTILLVEEEPKVEKPMKIGAIMENGFFMDGSWYKVGESIRSYKVLEINMDSVKLYRGEDSSTKILKLVEMPSLEVVRK